MRTCSKGRRCPRSQNLSQLWVFSTPHWDAHAAVQALLAALIPAAFQQHSGKTHPDFEVSGFQKESKNLSGLRWQKLKDHEQKRDWAGGASPVPTYPVHLPPMRFLALVRGAGSSPLSLQLYLVGPELHPRGRRWGAPTGSRLPLSRLQHPLAPSTKAAGPALPCAGNSHRYLLEHPGLAGQDVELNGPCQTGLHAGDLALGSRGSQNA